MKKNKKIFTKFFILATVFMLAPAFAANECMDDNNDAIAAEFALCSTHVYNIGETKNQDGANRDLMRDVIAMKTTVMTQQLYKQYEQMESVLQRFKTQLEKAVLADTLKAAGAKSEKDEDSSSSFKSTSTYIKVSGAQNCSNKLDEAEVLQCLYANYQLLDSVTANGTNVATEHKQQLASDYTLVCRMNKDCKKDDSNKPTNECAEFRKIKNKTKFDTCMDVFLNEIRKGTNRVKKENSKSELLDSLIGNK